MGHYLLNLPTHLPTYPHTYLPTHTPTYLPTHPGMSNILICENIAVVVALANYALSTSTYLGPGPNQSTCYLSW